MFRSISVERKVRTVAAAAFFSAAAASAVSVAVVQAPGVAVGGAADDPGLSLGFGAEVAAGPYYGLKPVFGGGYANRDFSPNERTNLETEGIRIGDVAVYHLSAGCEYDFLRGKLFGAFGNAGLLWAWEEAKLWNRWYYEVWSDSAPGAYGGAGVEFRTGNFAFALGPRYTVLFDVVPKTYTTGPEMEITYADGPSQFVDVLLRFKYSF